MKKISIVVPVYYNEENLLSLYADLKEKVINNLPKYDLDYELIFVDDGSKDNSYNILKDLAKLDNKIVLLKLSRNFGEHSALLAGLTKCTGDFAVRKAADLQEPSDLIIKMIEKYNEGNNVVIATRADREEPFLQKALSGLYASIMQKLALHNMPKGGFDSFLIDRQVIDVLVEMQEKNTSLMSQILWSGFKTGSVSYTRLKRTAGKSRWTFSKKIKLAIDSILSFSYFPIRFISGIGILSFLAALIASIVILCLKLTGTIDVEGYTSIIVLILFCFGVIMFSMGILGEYIWRAFDAARKRPPFIVENDHKEQ